jgi:outer membrane protein OmpA-like peptidoglycan-associated protein
LHRGVVVALLVVGHTAAADPADRASVRAEIGGGRMLSSYQIDMLDYHSVVQGSLRLGFLVLGPVAAQVSVMSIYAPSEMGAGSGVSYTGGLRIEPRVRRLRPFVDGNMGMASTGSQTRVAFDAGVGLSFAIGAHFVAGPYVRYTQVFADATDDFPSDARLLTAGVAVTFSPWTRRAKRPEVDSDSDGDGVMDRTDVCVQEPAGKIAAPDRPGCPADDTDGDRLPDFKDSCPTTAAGDTPDPRRPGCPDGDEDRDRTPDSSDRCPAVASGLNPDPAKPGCPLPDRDNDSVADGDDACPDMPGAPSTDRATRGCPGLVRVEAGMIQIQEPVFFDTGKDTLLTQSVPVLNGVAQALLATPAITLLSVEGHTDDVDDEAVNQELSQRRADRVMAWLIKAGVDASRLRARGFGKSRPLVNSTTKQARAVNRRVEFRIVGGESIK